MLDLQLYSSDSLAIIIAFCMTSKAVHHRTTNPNYWAFDEQLICDHTLDNGTGSTHNLGGLFELAELKVSCATISSL